MRTLTFEEFINEFGIDNKARSNIRIEDIGENISITPIEIVVIDQIPETIINRSSTLL